jgi:hypothetical protein
MARYTARDMKYIRNNMIGRMNKTKCSLHKNPILYF